MANLVSDHLFFAANGKYLIFARQDEINIWAFNDPHARLIIDGGFIGLSKDNNIVLARQGNIIHAHDIQSGDEVAIAPNQLEDYQRVTVSGKSPNLLLIQDVLNQNESKNLKSKDHLTEAVLNPFLIPNSPYLIAKTGWSDVGFEGESLECIDIRTGKMIFMTYATYDIEYRFTLSSDQKTLAIKGPSEIRVFDLETGKQLFEVRGNEVQFDDKNNIIDSPKYKYKEFALHPKATDILALIIENETWITHLIKKDQTLYKKYDTYSLPGKKLSTFSHQKSIDRIIFSPDGSQLACISMDKYWGCVLIVWELKDIQLDM